VVDEAGMGGVRDIATIIDQATRVGAKVVLVGDHHQLPEVGAGGAFRAALDTLGARVVELTVNRRQQHLWDQAALDQLRHGDVNTAFAAYLEHDRVVLTDNPDQLHTRAITDWQRLRTSGETLMLAGTRAEAHLLNQLARQLLADTGELDLAHEFEIGGRTYAPGDHVVLCRNHPGQHLQNGERFAVENGMLATIVDIDDNGVHVLLATGERVVLDRNYVERGWVDHAYALTIHKAQGVTCDHVLLVGPAGLYREGIYVALSRARHSAWIYTTSAQVVELD
jgi:ATP-dependent exoDNAse (exonuclease V) alpha subunit